MLVAALERLIHRRQLWQPSDRLLIAVSTGVDSMVLLHVLEQLHAKGLPIGVAHVNHQLREASKEEAQFLEAYCMDRQLPYYSKTWLKPATSNLEAEARAFRYAFFEEIMRAKGYTVLVTGHHSDDQMETMLMKMIRTGEAFASQGITLTQAFASGRLIRPFLYESKETLLEYAEQHQLTYYEDETNQTLDYQRNRLRHQVLPVLKGENTQALAHFQQLSEQLQSLEAWVAEEQATWLEQAVSVEEEGLTVDLNEFPFHSPTKQSFYLAAIVKKAQLLFQLTVSKKQTTKALTLLATNKPQWSIDLAQGWQFIRRYEYFYLQKKVAVPNTPSSIELIVNEGIFLDDATWLGLFSPNQLKIPEKVKNWSEFRQDLLLDSKVGLTIGHRQAGERIALSPTVTKKINRYFIDEKIPKEQREQAWVLRDENKKVLALLPYLLSHLSIGEETDKIHYVLLFKYEK